MSDKNSEGQDQTQAERDIERREWLESLDYVIQRGGPEWAGELLEHLHVHAQQAGVTPPFQLTTPYVNTLAAGQQPPYPGRLEIEQRIQNIIRWNAMAMVVRANRMEDGIGGHISTYASAATLFEVGFNHFFRARTDDQEADMVYFQGHATPGIYARSFLEGRLTKKHLSNFRREMAEGGGLSSYPHPWLMPDFWQFPTVSMGLSPIMAIYQARFNRYLEHRGLKEPSDAKVWVLMGDGETDEPESLGALSLAAREKLDNLIFVVNCNLQRLDGPVRGNGKIIQELEAVFRGAGWNVIKVIWGSEWDNLLAQDSEGLLAKRMGEVVDGQFQKYVVEGGSYFREDFFGKDPRLLKMVEHLSDDELEGLDRGGHDPVKVYAAYRAAVRHQGSPTVILAKTVKGYGLGESGEGKNITHQQKKMNEDELQEYRSRLGIPIGDDDVYDAPFYRPADNSPETQYLQERRQKLGGYVPKRIVKAAALSTPGASLYQEFFKGSERPAATTMAFVRLLTKLLRDKQIGNRIVPIIPDEARTFGMESLFRHFGIYSSAGQLYEPVDADTLFPYREARDGQILEEGITEAGSMSSFIAGGTAYATHGLHMIPFFIFYSMFGFQRIGDLVWAGADMRTRGFLIGGTAGRTTLAGEGLQHQDGHSHLLAYPVPTLRAYDPAFAYEIAVIVRHGLKRMVEENKDEFYYLTVGNETYPQPPMPEGVEEGILNGMYRFRTAGAVMAENGDNDQSDSRTKPSPVQILGSGAILNEALGAQEILAEKYGVAADVWSVTSYKALHRDALEVERRNLLYPERRAQLPYITQCLADSQDGVFVAASDYVKAIPYSLARWVPGRLTALGTDGFGRSESRRALRDFFEVDARYIAVAALAGMAAGGLGDISRRRVNMAMKDLEIDPDKLDPLIS